MCGSISQGGKTREKAFSEAFNSVSNKAKMYLESFVSFSLPWAHIPRAAHLCQSSFLTKLYSALLSFTVRAANLCQCSSLTTLPRTGGRSRCAPAAEADAPEDGHASEDGAACRRTATHYRHTPPKRADADHKAWYAPLARTDESGAGMRSSLFKGSSCGASTTNIYY